MELGLQGKLCVVTGGSRGIGLATAHRLVQEEARVLLVGRSEEPLRAAVDELGESADYIAADVTDPDADADDRIIATCAEQMGGVDVLVNNAGTSSVTPLD